MSAGTWIAVMVMILMTVILPFVLAGFFRARLHVPLRMFFIAAGFYIINLIVQQPFFFAVGALGITNRFLLLAVISPLTYAVCEETMRYLSFRAGKAMCANRTSAGALMAGIGHGGTESIVFSHLPILAVIIALTAPQALKGFGLTAAQILGGGTSYIVLAISRIFAMAAHLGFATLSVMAYRRSLIFLPLVMVIHFLVDATTFGVQVVTNNNPLWTQATFAVWALAAVVLIIYVRRTGILVAERAAAAEGSVRTQTKARCRGDFLWYTDSHPDHLPEE